MGCLLEGTLRAKTYLRGAIFIQSRVGVIIEVGASVTKNGLFGPESTPSQSLSFASSTGGDCRAFAPMTSASASKPESSLIFIFPFN